jgi:hypothetical protein
VSIAIVPAYLIEEADRRIDKALAGRPCDDEEREDIRRALLSHFNEHGTFPDFQLKAKDTPHA